MKHIKSLLLGTAFVTGTFLFLGSNDAFAAETYTVQSGDTLSSISYQYTGDNSLVDSIAADNQIGNVNLIYTGQQLVIDTDGTGATAAPAAETQTQAAAETQPAAEEAVQATEAAASTYTASTSDAKEWIAQKESSGSYTAQNGRYYGRYQLDSSYLNGDYSAENQERVADEYVTNRYGSWENAMNFWLANGWY